MSQYIIIFLDPQKGYWGARQGQLYCVDGVLGPLTSMGRVLGGLTSIEIVLGPGHEGPLGGGGWAAFSLAEEEDGEEQHPGRTLK